MTASSARATAELLDALFRRYHVEAFTGGLNPAQWAALRFFARDLTDSKTAVSLARFQGVSRASANDTVRALVRKGLLARMVSAEDGRRQEVSVTEQGMVVLEGDPLALLCNPINGLADEVRRDFAGVVSQLLAAMPAPSRGNR
ncbi:MarR family transcriptional regulator [Azospirillum sp.]|uniref:MarR family transcriptional regulator n=1 Tax=Azospirillum sp. TaxID=34012 RepID=UPI003D71E2DE